MKTGGEICQRIHAKIEQFSLQNAKPPYRFAYP